MNEFFMKKLWPTSSMSVLLLITTFNLSTVKSQDLSQTLGQFKDKLAELFKKLSKKELMFGTVEAFIESADCANCTHLNLNLWNKQIENEEIASIAGILEKFTKLTSLNLNLGLNNIGPEGAKSIAGAIEKLTNLTYLNLYLWRNRIGPEGAESIAVALKELQNLTSLKLDLVGNQIVDEGAK
jgi:hypothetical protein